MMIFLPSTGRPGETAGLSHRDTAAEGNAAFAFDLYRALKASDGNLFFSPHSISTALAMTYGGARGATEKQMAEVLHFTLPRTDLHPAFSGLEEQLTAITEFQIAFRKRAPSS